MSNCWAMMFTSALVGRVEAGLAQPGVQLGLVAEAPRTDLLALQVLGLGDVLVLERDLERRRALEDLGDDDAVGARLARREHARHPADAELGLAAGDDGRRNDLDRAGQDRDVEAFVPVVALVEGREVAGELGLWEPLELELDRLQRRGTGSSGLADEPPLLEQAASTSIVATNAATTRKLRMEPPHRCRTASGSRSSSSDLAV